MTLPPSAENKTLEELVALQLNGKSQKFCRKFYRWYQKNRLSGRLSRPPNKAEIEIEIIIERASKYGVSDAKHARDLIRAAAGQYERLFQFPMKFKECLSRVIGGQLYSERLCMFRKFLSAQLEMSDDMRSNIQGGAEAEERRIKKANEMIERFKKLGVNEEWFNRLSHQFPEWRVENGRQQGINMANSRWKNKSKNYMVAKIRSKVGSHIVAPNRIPE